MSLITIIAADTLPVTLEATKKYLRVDHADDDDDITRAVKAAVDHIERHTSMVLARSTLQARYSEWPCWGRGLTRGYHIDLPRAPVRDVISVEYVDENDDVQTVSASNWSWRRTGEGALVRFKSDYTFPALTIEEDAGIRITFEAGYDGPGESGSGDDPDLTLPPVAEQLVLLLTSLWYERREFELIEQLYPVKTMQNMLAQLRVYR